MHYTEFAKAIKKKYPVYENVDDYELSKRYIKKYPVYGNMVEFDDMPNQTVQNIQQPKPMVQQVQRAVPSAPQPTIEQVHVPTVEEMNVNDQVNTVNKYPETLVAHPELKDTIVNNINNMPLDGQVSKTEQIKRNMIDMVKRNSLPIQNFRNTFDVQEPLSTGNLDYDSLTNEERLANDLPLAGEVSNNGLANKYEKSHPFRDFGTNVGRFLLPKKIENALYGTMEERELLKSGSAGILTPAEANELLKSGKIDIDTFKFEREKYDNYQSALLDRKQREIALKRTGEAALQLGLALPFGLGAAGVGGAAGVAGATGNLAGRAVFGIGKNLVNPRTAIAAARATRNVVKPLATDALTGAGFGAATNTYENIAGLEPEESLGGAIAQGAIGGVGIGAGFRGAGLLGKAALKTELANKTGNAISKYYDGLIDSARKNGHPYLAGSLESLPANTYRMFSSDIELRKWWSDKTKTKTKLSDMITDYNSGNQFDKQEILNDVTKLQNSYSPAEQDAMFSYTQSGTDLNGRNLLKYFKDKFGKKTKKSKASDEPQGDLNEENLNEGTNTHAEENTHVNEPSAASDKVKPLDTEALAKHNKDYKGNPKFGEIDKEFNAADKEADENFVNNLIDVFKSDKNARKGRPRGSKNKTKRAVSDAAEINKLKTKEAENAYKKAQKEGIEDNLYTEPKAKESNMQEPIALDNERVTKTPYFKEGQVKLVNRNAKAKLTKLKSQEEIETQERKDAIAKRAKQENKTEEEIEEIIRKEEFEKGDIYKNVDTTSEYYNSDDYKADLKKAKRNKKAYEQSKEDYDAAKEDQLEADVKRLNTKIADARNGYKVALAEGNKPKAMRLKNKALNLEARRREAFEKLQKYRSKRIHDEAVEETNDYIAEDPNAIYDEAVQETSQSEYNKYSDNLSEVITEDTSKSAKYTDAETGKFIEKLKSLKDEEAIQKEIDKKLNEIGTSKDKVEEFVTNIYNEIDKKNLGRNYRVGEQALKEAEDKEIEALQKIADEIYIRADKIKTDNNFGLNKVSEYENKKANESLVSALKKNAGTEYKTGKKEFGNEVIDKLENDMKAIDKQIAKTNSKAEIEKLRTEKSKLIEAKTEVNKRVTDEIYRKPETAIYNKLKTIGNPQEIYDSMVKSLTDINQIKYSGNKRLSEVALKKLNKVAEKLTREDGINIKKTPDVNSVIRKQGNEVMASLDKANKEGSLRDGFEIIEANRDLIEFNLDKDYKWKYFDDKAIEEHYNQSYYEATTSLRNLMNERTRVAELKNIYKKNWEARYNFLKKQDSLTKSQERELKELEKANWGKSLDTDTPAEIKLKAIARAREIYKANRRLISRYMTDYSHPSKMTEKNGNWYRHYFEKEINDNFDPSEEFKRYDDNVMRFLDVDHWKDNPFKGEEYFVSENRFAKPGDISKTDLLSMQRGEDNKIALGYIKKQLRQGIYGKDSKGNWFKTKKEKLENYYNKHIKPIEEQYAAFTNGVQKDKFYRAHKFELESYYKYAKYLDAFEKYKAQSSFRKDASKFATKTLQGFFKKSDNPFKRSYQDYYDTKTGSINKTLVYNDLNKLKNPRFIEEMAAADAKKQHRSYDYMLNKYQKFAKEFETNYGWEVEGFNGYEKESFKFANKVKKEPDHYFAKEMSEHPETSVIFTTDPDKTGGNIAKAYFYDNGKHKIYIDKNYINADNELTILGEEIEHIKQFDAFIARKREDIYNLKEAFDRADETQLLYDMNPTLVREMDAFVDKHGIEKAKEVFNPEQLKIKENIDLARENQANTNLEREAHGSYRRRFRESTEGGLDNAPTEVSTSSKDSNGQVRNTKGRSTSVSDASANGGEGKFDLSVFNGKGLNKVKQLKTFRKLVDELTPGKKAGMNKRIEDAVSVAEQLELTAEDFGVSKNQAINRALMDNGLLYMRDYYGLEKEAPKDFKEFWEGFKEYIRPKMSWNKAKGEKEGTFGKKEGKANQSTFSETQYANKIELNQRLKVLNITKYAEENFGKPLTERLNGYRPVNRKLLNITLKNKYGADFYDGMMGGEETIKKMFKNDPKACKAWLNVAKEIKAGEADYQLPKDVFTSMMIDTGEKAGAFWDRYSWKKFGKVRGAIKYAQAFYDYTTGSFVRKVLALNPGWTFGNTINDTIKVLIKRPSAFKYLAEALRARKSTLPKVVTEDNMFETNKAWLTYQEFTGKNGVDCALNLLSGRAISTAELNGIKKYLADAGNLGAMPRQFVHALSKANMAANSAVQTKLRTMVWYNALESYQKARCKNIVHNVFKQSAYLEMLSKKGLNDPKLRQWAEKQIFETLGDYTTASPFEQKVVQRVAPFYKWYRHITRYIGDIAKNDPTKLALVFLNLKKIADDDVYSKGYQKGMIPLNKKGFGINASRYLNIFDTHEDLFDNPTSMFQPLINDAKTALTGKNFLGKPLTTKRYTEEFGKVYDTKKQEFVRDEKGNYLDRTPIGESIKYFPVNFTRNLIPELNSNLISLEKIGAGINHKNKTGKFKTPDKMYDTSFGGFNKGDKYAVKNDEGFIKEKERFANNYTRNQKIARSLFGGMLQNKYGLNKTELERVPWEKMANNSRLLNLIPTPTYARYKKIGKLAEGKAGATSEKRYAIRKHNKDDIKKYTYLEEQYLEKIREELNKINKKKRK